MRARSGAYTALAVVAWIFAACILVQVFLAGMGVFDGPERFETHRNFGYTFGWLTLVMVIIAAVGRLGRVLVGLSLLALVQFFLQSVFILFRESQPAIAALHPVNGVLLLVVAIAIGRIAWAGRRAAIRSAAGAPDATATPAAGAAPG
jgi:mercuric ion transport protein